MTSNLTRQERIVVRHILQEVGEQVRMLRDAVEPLTGMLAVSRDRFNENLEEIIERLEDLKKLCGKSNSTTSPSRRKQQHASYPSTTRWQQPA